MSNQKTIVIVGSGLSSLMLAKMIRKYKNPTAKIVIVEREKEIGGQYGGKYYDEIGFFDYGMHIYYDSCVPEIDDLFQSVLPDSEWNIHEGNKKDIAGIFFNGKLQLDTPYVDLRNIDEKKWSEYVGDLFLNLKKSKHTELPVYPSAEQLLKKHFGDKLTDEIFAPILEKLYLTDLSELAEFSTLLTAINRVALFDEDIVEDLIKSGEIQSRICYPDQLGMKVIRKSKQRALYPKKFGFMNVILTLKKQLEESGVEILTSTTITDINIEQNAVSSISLTGEQGDQKIEDIQTVFWTAGLPPLANSLQIDLKDLKNEPKNTEAYYVNFLFDKKPNMGDLYYFYIFDKGYRSFRVTSYSNYCPDAVKTGGYPLCVEIWLQQDDAKDVDQIVNRAKDELRAFGVINESYNALFEKAEKGHGFPTPTLKNIANMREIKHRIKNKNITNLIPTGILTEDNVFFIKDVLIDVYTKMNSQSYEN